VDWARVVARTPLLVQPVVGCDDVLAARFDYYHVGEVHSAPSDAGVCSIAGCVRGFEAGYATGRKICVRVPGFQGRRGEVTLEHLCKLHFERVSRAKNSKRKLCPLDALWTET
jgi:hypothetical protein